MATGTAGTTARKFTTQQMHYLRADISFEQNGGIVGVLPGGALLVRGTVYTHTGFNDTTADDIDIGTVASDDKFADAIDMNSAGTTAFDSLTIGDMLLSVDTTVIWSYTSAATADGTAGSATIVIEFIPDNDR